MDKDELWRKTLSLMLENAEGDDLKEVFLKRLSPLGVFGDQFILLAQDPQVEAWVRSNYLAELDEKLSLVSESRLNVGLAVAQAPVPEPSAPPRAEGTAPGNEAPNRQETQEPHEPPWQQPEWASALESPGADARQDPAEPEWMNTYVSLSELQHQDDDHPAAEELVKHGSAYTRAPGTGDEALFEKCTFDTFVVGKSNQFARGAALSVAEKPGTLYNPLFIYGNSGLGKTHLLVAIANYVLENWPRMVTCYASANQFLNDYVEAAQHHQWANFNKKYHQADVLLIDDVQYLEGAEATIDQLFNIFNEMTNRNKQIVLAADRAPKDIDMDERYRSRFMSGLLADIKPPDYETRLAIMKNYLASVNHQGVIHGYIPDEVLEWLAGKATSNIREMEGAINRLVFNMGTLGTNAITVDEAQDILEDFFPNLTNKQVDIATIQSEVERFFGITHDQMVGKTRAKGVTTPRHIAIYLSRYLTEESLESIGKKFGGRDHTTVMHSVHKIEDEQRDNRVLLEQIDQLTIRIKEHS